MSSIPYTVERRPDTGVNNVQMGIWLFLASEVMLFGGLFSAYFMLRAGSLTPWVPLRDHLGSALLSTALLMVATGLTATAVGPRGSLISASDAPAVLGPHSRNVPSSPVDARLSPSALNVTA